MINQLINYFESRVKNRDNWKHFTKINIPSNKTSRLNTLPRISPMTMVKEKNKNKFMELEFSYFLSRNGLSRSWWSTATCIACVWATTPSTGCTRSRSRFLIVTLKKKDKSDINGLTINYVCDNLSDKNLLHITLSSQKRQKIVSW